MSENEKIIRKAIKNLKKLLKFESFPTLTHEKIKKTINDLECDLIKLNDKN